MVNIILSGCNGQMGQAIAKAINNRSDSKIVSGVDINKVQLNNFPVYTSFKDIKEKADVIIDFSNPNTLNNILEYGTENNIPCILCTTGYSNEDDEKIKNASKNIGIFKSGNMSLGINLMIELSKKAASVLGKDFDIEIIEKHHNQKIDAPSGTALMIADGVSDTLKEKPQYVYDREKVRKKREKNEIGISTIRGGTIVGEHEILFAGLDEILSIKHNALSKEVFATGAINAAIYMKGKKPGMYDMSNLLSSIMDI